jgi:hypothetical protein
MNLSKRALGVITRGCESVPNLNISLLTVISGMTLSSIERKGYTEDDIHIDAF